MKRFSILLFGIFSYALFLGTYLYFIAFVGGFSTPHSVDAGIAAATPAAVFINLLLISLFALQHSVMARPAFKRRWTRIIPRVAERSTYVLVSSLLLILLMWQWRLIPGYIWSIENEIARMFIYYFFGLGALVAIASSFMINHAELFGLQQVYLYWRRKAFSPPQFQTPWLYKIIRHPIQAGQLIFFWVTPEMSFGHLLLALGMSIYTLIGLWFEERDLVRYIGDEYVEYRQQVPRLIPFLNGSGEIAKRSGVYSE